MEPMILIEKYNQNIDEIVLLRAFSALPRTAILDSSMRSEDVGKFTFIAFDPFLFMTSEEDGVYLSYEDETEIHDHPLDVLKTLLKKYQIEKQPSHLPFLGGCIGYFSYDLVDWIEPFERVNSDDLSLPQLALGFYHKIIGIDHQTNEIYLISSSIGCHGEPKEAALKNLEAIKIKLENLKVRSEKPITDEQFPFLKANFQKESYMEIVQRAREYIRNGDIFQVNLAQRFETKIQRSPIEIYLNLRKKSPAPFASYLNFGDVTILSSSPERFLKIEGKNIETRPIKGTRPRGQDLHTDEMMRQELLNSEKEMAELTMIVDLERNDLGRICEFGSVKVEKHFEIETYTYVFHSVSTVTGILREGIDAVDCLKATFPGGSITGAPKIRAMEIIEELEPVRRGIYTGAIGYIGFDGSVDLNIAIRTIIVKEDNAYYHVGGGIVWDSDPEKEYEETLHKGKVMAKVLTE